MSKLKLVVIGNKAAADMLSPYVDIGGGRIVAKFGIVSFSEEDNMVVLDQNPRGPVEARFSSRNTVFVSGLPLKLRPDDKFELVPIGGVNFVGIRPVQPGDPLWAYKPTITIYEESPDGTILSVT